MNGSIHGIIYKNGKIRLTGNGLDTDLSGIRNSDSPILNAEVYLVPVDGKWWLSPKDYPEEWEFRNTFCHTPGWFRTEKCEVDFRKAAFRWWKKHVRYRKDISALSSGIYLVKECYIGEVSGNTRFMCCDSYVVKMKDEATAIEVNGRSCINTMAGKSRIEELNDYSFVRMMLNHASVKEMSNSATIESMESYSSVEMLCGYSRIYTMADHSCVNSLLCQAVIYQMLDESTVDRVESLAHILAAPKEIKLTSRRQQESSIPFN